MARVISAVSTRDEDCMVLSGNSSLFSKINSGTTTITCIDHRIGSIKCERGGVEFFYLRPGTFAGLVVISDEILIIVFSFLGQMCHHGDCNEVY